MKNLSKDQIKENQEYVKKTMEIEGLKASDEAIKINKDFLENKITSDEAIKRIKNLNRSKYCVMTGRLGKW